MSHSRRLSSCRSVRAFSYQYRGGANLGNYRGTYLHYAWNLDCKIFAVAMQRGSYLYNHLFPASDICVRAFTRGCVYMCVCVYVGLMIRIITDGLVYIRMWTFKYLTALVYLLRRRCIVGTTLCGCIWLFDKMIAPGKLFFSPHAIRQLPEDNVNEIHSTYPTFSASECWDVNARIILPSSKTIINVFLTTRYVTSVLETEISLN